MYAYLRPRHDLTYLVRIFGDQEQEERVRTAARRAGLRPVRCQDEHGYPALAVTLRGGAEVGTLVELMLREGVSGWLEPVS